MTGKAGEIGSVTDGEATMTIDEVMALRKTTTGWMITTTMISKIRTIPKKSIKDSWAKRRSGRIMITTITKKSLFTVISVLGTYH